MRSRGKFSISSYVLYLLSISWKLHYIAFEISHYKRHRLKHKVRPESLFKDGIFWCLVRVMEGDIRGSMTSSQDDLISWRKTENHGDENTRNKRIVFRNWMESEQGYIQFQPLLSWSIFYITNLERVLERVLSFINPAGSEPRKKNPAPICFSIVLLKNSIIKSACVIRLWWLFCLNAHSGIYWRHILQLKSQ